MKLKKRKVLCLDFEIDKSEAIMFNKGGKQLLTYKVNDEEDYAEGETIAGFKNWIEDCDEIQIGFQISRDQLSSFQSTISEASQHRSYWNEENELKKKSLESYESHKSYREVMKLNELIAAEEKNPTNPDYLKELREKKSKLMHVVESSASS